MNDNEKHNETFMNPSQADNVDNILKCEKSEFKTSKRQDITNHK
jgi:hypothetical protein